MTDKNSKETKNRRRLQGVVVCDKANKTVRVRVERRVRHPLYGKTIRLRSNIQAHDEENKCCVGDDVIVEESPRFSKTKGWLIVDSKNKEVS